jgi:acyl-CoA synthetase (NDP forming)
MQAAAGLIQRAVSAERASLLEHEGYTLLAALGVRTPPWVLLPAAEAATQADLAALGPRVVVKVSSHAVAHKTDVGGVTVVENSPPGVRAAIAAMRSRLDGVPVDGYLVAAFVPHAEALGAELVLALRQTDDFGPVVTVGTGGQRAELIAESLRPGKDVAVFAADAAPPYIARRLAALPVTRIACGLARGAPRLVSPEVLADLVRRFLEFGAGPIGARVSELEVNPLGLTATGPVALDVLVRLRAAAPAAATPRPLHKLAHLLRPRSIAIVGVSEGVNAGRLILRNVLNEGFPPDRIRVIKPGTDRVDGVRCVPSLGDLADPVDLCVLALAASRIPDLMDEIVRDRRAESVVVIPGGLGERPGSGSLEDQLRRTIAEARGTRWGGPVVNGGNCLGVRSAPGRLDTTFIPPHKLGAVSGRVAPVALLAQSGAFAVARWSKLGDTAPRYLVSVGNQTDLTIGDYLTYLADDPEVRVFACYVEAFRPGDGAHWLRAARRIARGGRTVLLYRAARTPEGRAAGQSHTAAIAGAYAVTRELAQAAGVLVADTLDEFDDLLRVTALLADVPLRGPRVGAVSNAGFECVLLGDGAGVLEYPPLGAATVAGVAAVLERQRLGGIVDVRHPLDVTPMMDDAALAEVVGLLLADDAVDVGVVGVVPLTGALHTLPAGEAHRERLEAGGAIASRLARLRCVLDKPFVVVVDAGPAYDPLAAYLDRHRIPTFRSMDRALRAIARLVGRPAGTETPAEPPALAGAGT